MNKTFLNYLFNKHILVSQNPEDSHYQAETEIALAILFNIRILSGQDLLEPGMIRVAQDNLGINVPAPFYTGFPQSVRYLLPEELLLDQLIHYTITYGLGHFDRPGHSLLEEPIERLVFNEKDIMRDFRAVSEDEALKIIANMVNDLLAGTRPLSAEQFKLVAEYLTEFDEFPAVIASKNTAIRLLDGLRDVRYADFLALSDVPKLVDDINFRFYENKNLRKLKLRNQDRKLITAVIDRILARGNADVLNCYENKAVWSGLLHHIHYHHDRSGDRIRRGHARGGKPLRLFGI